MADADPVGMTPNGLASSYVRGPPTNAARRFSVGDPAWRRRTHLVDVTRRGPGPSRLRSVVIAACVAGLGFGWLLFWAAPAGAWRAAEPTIASASVSVEAATSQSLHDQCASVVSTNLCETALTVIHAHVQIPAGGGEDCEGPARVGYVSDIGGDGHLSKSWPGGDWESNCYAMEGCSESSACELSWPVYPFAYGGIADCTNRGFAVEVSLDFLGNGEGYSKAYPISIEPPSGCNNGRGQSGGGSQGGGAGSSGTGGSCLTTSTCVIPLNYSGVVRGQPYVAHADGSRTPFRDVTSLKSGDWIRTGSNGVARWGIGYSNGVGIACAMWVGPNSSLGFTTLLITTRGIFFVTAMLSKGEAVVQQAVIPVTLDTPNAIVKTASAAGASRASAAATGATFTVQKTGSSSLVQVYGGSVTVSDAHGKHTIVVRAGFESSVKGSGPPSRARRFKAPKHRFWH